MPRGVQVHTRAVGALHNLTADAKVISTMRHANVIPVLVKMLRSAPCTIPPVHRVLTQPSRYEAGWILVCWLTFVCDGVTWQLADPGGVQRGGGGTAEPLARGALQVGDITNRA